MAEEHNSLSIKKQFLNRVFFPVGPHVCKLIGIMPSSPEVQEFEQVQSQQEVLTGVSVWSDFIMERARWYCQGVEALEGPEDSPVEPRTLEEHLCSFALSIMADERLIQ